MNYKRLKAAHCAHRIWELDGPLASYLNPPLGGPPKPLPPPLPPLSPPKPLPPPLKPPPLSPP